MSRKILLAEDDADDQKIFHDFLSARTDIHLLPPAENGEELLSMLEEGIIPDFIILDQNMPKRNGLQTLQSLKKTESYAHIPVIVYSTYADSSLIEKSTQLGAIAVWAKPITKEGYDELVDFLLKLPA